jgi:hypothetical protein
MILSKIQKDFPSIQQVSIIDHQTPITNSFLEITQKENKFYANNVCYFLNLKYTLK